MPCIQCEYNVKTLPATGVCPECATPVIDSLPGGKRICTNCGNGQPRSQGETCGKCGTVLPPWPEITAPSGTTAPAPVATPQAQGGFANWLRNHPLADKRFAFFIFCLIPVQTLFAYNFGTLQAYVDRAFRGTWIGTNFEAATNLNALLIFVLVPIVTAFTQKFKVYNMMIVGTLIMAVPTFLLAMATNLGTLAGFIIIMTIGEAIWQPRFLQYAAQIAPEGRTGAYMGVAQLPWFLTKIIVPVYEGWFLQKYCPRQGELNTQRMWLIFGCIAIVTPILLTLAKPWIGRNMKTHST